MKVVLKNNDYNVKDIYLIDENKTLSIMFAGTGDLYWIIKNTNINENDEYSYDSFEITRENYQIYNLFQKVFDDIKSINIFDEELEFPPYVETDEERKEYLENIEFDKKRYRFFNMSHYNDLYDEETETITWISDETAYEVGNVVTIKKVNDKFLIEFKTQPYIEGFDKEDNTLGMMAIRFRNSGSRYNPFNMIFMRLFKNLQSVDDVNDYGHQLHMEEYLYEKNKIKSLLNKKMKGSN